LAPNRDYCLTEAIPIPLYERRLATHCCRFPHDKVWTAVDPELTFLSDRDVATIMERERAGESDDVRHPPGSGKYVRDDIRPGEDVEIEVFGRRVLAVLSGLSPSGKAIVETLLFHRPVTTELDAALLRKVAAVT
jgi:hypothetical protein